ncbi:beta-ketoacyl-ACP synthase 3 [Kineosporia succinea]|uniref:3-oxoacyl-[acyl-carrier-protein] synthase-3 n=1 Tax=Kineosporia succinea TaxID=84632 RepID=A0ABT9P6U3_9ACTN|nr:beta-ketoacyl-ACP synthase 3 [Kineosporia succinea]MDP9828418.1 3-oxoacyl-[acyl-carrier-protein] synthase-3 [Kineosporia succinea]
MTAAAVIEAIGHYLPGRRESNDELALRMDTSDEWIRTRTGILGRARAEPGQATSDLAVEAGRHALQHTGASVDTVVVATTTPDRKCPATAPVVADRLGLGRVTSFDLNSACTGFLAGMSVASGLVATGAARGVLLIGAEKYSTIVYPDDRGTAPIFGDGAAAMVLRAGTPDEPGAIGAVHLSSDGSLWELAHVRAGGSLRPVPDPDDPHDAYLRMNGRATYRHAVAEMAASCRLALAARGLAAHDVDRLVAHQANVRILQEVARELGIPGERSVVDLTDIGNTAAASIPMALSRAHAAGTLTGRERLLLTAFGAGASWGATVVTWPHLKPHPAPHLAPHPAPHRQVHPTTEEVNP